MSPGEPVKKSGDPLKYYCIVFGLLILVVGFVYFKLKAELKDYKTANVYAEKVLTGKGLPTTDSRERPNKFSELALGVDNMVKGYAQAVGGSGEGSVIGISQGTMDEAAREAKVKIFSQNAERRDENKGKGYLDIYREFIYEPTTLENLIALVFNVEELGRYRVTEVRWALRDEKNNSAPPYTLIQKPSIKVSFRRPLTSGRN